MGVCRGPVARVGGSGDGSHRGGTVGAARTAAESVYGRCRGRDGVADRLRPHRDDQFRSSRRLSAHLPELRLQYAADGGQLHGAYHGHRGHRLLHHRLLRPALPHRRRLLNVGVCQHGTPGDQQHRLHRERAGRGARHVGAGVLPAAAQLEQENGGRHGPRLPPHLFLNYLANVPLIVFIMYALITHIRDNPLMIGACCVSILAAFAQVAAVSFAAAWIHKWASKPKELLHDMRIPKGQYPNLSDTASLTLLLDEVGEEYIGVTAWRLVVITKKFIVTALGLIISYIIILYEFGHLNEVLQHVEELSASTKRITSHLQGTQLGARNAT
ncbi:uncharacterized protein LOC129582182 isoform X2 [Paramacrobiotus metropolitanus]|uniref:uncharacterized protein LOC129582182 isoform X2 n=1 Tax=Paramacrobiotus metropolitanus TaxID=2943436 RepID=UPI002445BF86|nr:uncharacterized protein LOC129582182 isoform X2 [Paramacrobiotus metropolitanus]